MKTLTKSEQKRYKALTAIAAKTRSDEEVAELALLQKKIDKADKADKAKAKAAKLTDDEQERLTELREKSANAELDGDNDQLDDDETAELKELEAKSVAAAGTITRDQLKELFMSGFKSVLDERGLTKGALETVIDEAIEKRLGEDDDESATQEDLKALTKEIKSAVEELIEDTDDSVKVKSGKNTGITFEDARDAVVEATKGIHSKSKMRFQKSGGSRNFQKASLADRQLVNVVMKRALNEGISEAEAQEAAENGEFLTCEMQKTLKDMEAYVQAKQGHEVRELMGKLRQQVAKSAMTTSSSGFGAELVPTDLASQAQQRLYLNSRLAAIMGAREINMPTDPFPVPFITTRPVFLGVAEGAAIGETRPGTGKLTLDAQKVAGTIPFTYEMEEDSILAVLPLIRGAMDEGIRYTYESMLINGDTTGTHMDSDTQAISGAAEKYFKGFRKLALAGSLTEDLSSGGIDLDNIRAIEKHAGIHSLDPARVIWLAGPRGAHDLKAIPEVTTVANFGPGATILKGILPSIDGIEIVQSQAVREDLNASGVYDGTTDTLGSLLLVYPEGFLTGRRREITFEFYKAPLTQTNYLIVSFRKAFSPVEVPSASIPTVVMGYNYTA